MNLRPHGIEVDVVHQARKRTPLFNQDAFVAALKQMSSLAMESLEAVGKAPLQPSHAPNSPPVFRQRVENNYSSSRRSEFSTGTSSRLPTELPQVQGLLPFPKIDPSGNSPD